MSAQLIKNPNKPIRVDLSCVRIIPAHVCVRVMAVVHVCACSATASSVGVCAWCWSLAS
jgi:hypothetical protein